MESGSQEVRLQSSFFRVQCSRERLDVLFSEGNLVLGTGILQQRNKEDPGKYPDFLQVFYCTIIP